MLFDKQGNNNQTNQEDETKGLEREGLGGGGGGLDMERLEREGVKRLFIV